MPPRFTIEAVYLCLTYSMITWWTFEAPLGLRGLNSVCCGLKILVKRLQFMKFSRIFQRWLYVIVIDSPSLENHYSVDLDSFLDILCYQHLLYYIEAFSQRLYTPPLRTRSKLSFQNNAACHHLHFSMYMQLTRLLDAIMESRTSAMCLYCNVSPKTHCHQVHVYSCYITSRVQSRDVAFVSFVCRRIIIEGLLFSSVPSL